MRLLAIAGAVLLGALLIFVGAFGARWLAPDGDAGGDPAPVAVSAAAPAAGETGALDMTTVGQLLNVLDARRRQQILGSAENFERFVQQETINQAVLRAAYANGADDNEQIRVLMERAGQRVLVEAYLNEVVRRNLDPSFPSDAQVREAYENNQDAFRVPKRMHLWQIFIPLGADADDAELKEAWQLADRMTADLRAGKADFASLAKAHSGHEASRLNDGYMGLIKVSDLLPPIAEAAATLEVDGISDPIATETGLHVIRRGSTVEEELVAFEKLAPQIRQQLLREAGTKLRQAALEKIVEEYPVEGPDGDLAAWREKLQKRNTTDVTGTRGG